MVFLNPPQVVPGTVRLHRAEHQAEFPEYLQVREVTGCPTVGMVGPFKNTSDQGTEVEDVRLVGVEASMFSTQACLAAASPLLRR